MKMHIPLLELQYSNTINTGPDRRKMNLILTTLLLSSQINLDRLQLQEGFSIEIFASNVVKARQMTLGDNGTVFSGTRNEGKVYAIIDNNKDGKADRHFLIDDNFNMPSGVAF